jgi:hypothetical protein
MNTPNDTSPSSPGRRRTGKVARLPHAVRERLNQFLDDGLTYVEILNQLGDDGKHLSLANLSNWRAGGYQDWLKAQAWADDLQARRQMFESLASGEDGLLVPEGGLQMAALKISESIRDLFLSDGSADSDPAELARLANSLARLSRTLMDFQKLREAKAAAQLELQRPDPARQLSQRENDLINNRMDDFFGVSLKPRTKPVITPDRSTISDPLSAISDPSPKPSSTKPPTEATPNDSPPILTPELSPISNPVSAISDPGTSPESTPTSRPTPSTPL